MLRKTITLSVALVLALGLGVSSAFAWGNGADLNGDGIGDNGYGTHDWILEHAIDLAGSDADWVDVEAALLASDDPDSTKTSKYMHGFKEFGRGRGAPQAVADEYHKLVKAYNAGDYKTASRHLGALSHYYADACQPFHTKYDSVNRESLHRDYELDTQPLTNRFSASKGWITARSRYSVSDVRDKTVSAGKYSRSKYNALVRDYSKRRNLSGGDSKAITGLVLSRAVNDLADIVCAVDDGKGLAENPDDIRVTMSKQYPAQKSNVCAYAKVVDSNGKPMEGVGVKLSWPLSNGTETVTVYTEPDGVAHWWQNIGPASMMKRRSVESRSHSSGTTTVDSGWYIPSPKLASGTKGVRTTLSNRTPKQGTVVRAKTKFRSVSGKPVKGLKVTFTWQFKSGTKKTYAYTNAKGNAYSSLNIGKAKKGYPVRVRGRAMSGGSTRSSSTTFRPK